MSDIALRVENLSKRYRLGQQGPERDFRETITSVFQGPFKRNAGKDATNGSEPSKTHLWALKDVRFEVKQGEAVAIIGRNGAGKSTLLKILSRITRPTIGFAEIHGRAGSLLEVGTGFHPDLSGRENVFLNGAILGMRKAEITRRFDEIVAFSELERFIDTPVKHYSSGMYLRLAFAVAAHLEPEILILDEVLAVGDAAFQRKCLGKMSDVSRAGRTVMFVSHSIPAVTRLCARAILLEEGTVVADGPSMDVATIYTDRVLETTRSRAWSLDEAPGQDGVKLISVDLLRGDESPTSIASVEDSLKLRIGYHVAQPGLSFRCAAIFNTGGLCAFGVVEPRESVKPRAGLYYSTVEIPAHLLTDAEYSVNVSLLASRGVKSHYVSQQDVLSFQVVDPMNGTSARGDYTERIAGVVRPRLEWQVSEPPL